MHRKIENLWSKFLWTLLFLISNEFGRIKIVISAVFWYESDSMDSMISFQLPW